LIDTTVPASPPIPATDRRRPWINLRLALSRARTPHGRVRFLSDLRHKPEPLLAWLAGRYRAGWGSGTRVVAVVGSFGKTTTTSVVMAALAAQRHQRPNANGGAAIPLAVLGMRPWHRHAVLEVGIRQRGQMAHRARVVRPNVAIVTGIGSEHNRSLRTLEVTRHEKAEMVRSLPPDGLAVLNGDDPNVVWMRSETRARVSTYGFGERNDVRATDVALDWPRGTTFTLHAAGQQRTVRIRLLGRYQVYPVLAALTVALEEGFSLDEVLPRVEAVEAERGRMAVLPLESGAIVIRDEYKSAIETVDAAFDVFAEIPARRRIVVLGDVSEPPGSQGPIYRRLGERIASSAHLAILVGGSGCRSYVVGAKRAGMPADALIEAKHGLRRAVELLRQELGPGDVVLIKGRTRQHLERVAIALAGRPVRCERVTCDLPLGCERCPFLARGSGPPI
jgi:UDP-N-acetylmuramoyl-tripeptide--D-alanyl-D-alanine ligase